MITPRCSRWKWNADYRRQAITTGRIRQWQLPWQKPSYAVTSNFHGLFFISVSRDVSAPISLSGYAR
jgi:hypothetical protein